MDIPIFDLSDLQNRWQAMLRAEGAQTEVKLPAIKKACGDVHRMLCPDAAGHALPEWSLGLIFVGILIFGIVLFVKLKRRGPDPPKTEIDKMQWATQAEKEILKLLTGQVDPMPPEEEGQPPPLVYRAVSSNSDTGGRAMSRDKPGQSSAKEGILRSVTSSLGEGVKRAIASTQSSRQRRQERREASSAKKGELAVSSDPTSRPTSAFGSFEPQEDPGLRERFTGAADVALGRAEAVPIPEEPEFDSTPPQGMNSRDFEQMVNEISSRLENYLNSEFDRIDRENRGLKRQLERTESEVSRLRDENAELKDRIYAVEQRVEAVVGGQPQQPQPRRREDPLSRKLREFEGWDEQELKRYILDFNPYINGAILDRLDRHILIKLAALAQSGEEFQAEIRRVTDQKAQQYSNPNQLFAPAEPTPQGGAHVHTLGLSSLRGMTEEQARQAVLNANHTVGGKVEEYNPDVEKKLVIEGRAGQQPQSVVLVISKGKKPAWIR